MLSFKAFINQLKGSINDVTLFFLFFQYRRRSKRKGALAPRVLIAFHEIEWSFSFFIQNLVKLSFLGINFEVHTLQEICLNPYHSFTLKHDMTFKDGEAKNQKSQQKQIF